MEIAIIVFVVVFASVVVIAGWINIWRAAKRYAAAQIALERTIAPPLPPEEINRVGLFSAALYRNENYWGD